MERNEGRGIPGENLFGKAYAEDVEDRTRHDLENLRRAKSLTAELGLSEDTQYALRRALFGTYSPIEGTDEDRQARQK